MAQVTGWLSWIVMVVGLWFVASPFVYGYFDLAVAANVGPFWNSVIAGAVVAILSGINGVYLLLRPAGRVRTA